MSESQKEQMDAPDSSRRTRRGVALQSQTDIRKTNIAVRKAQDKDLFKGEAGVEWLARFEDLKAFRSRYGHFEVPPQWDGNKALGPFTFSYT